MTIENLQNPGIFNEVREIKGWDTLRGHYLDTTHYQYVFDSRNKILFKTIYTYESDNRIILFYFSKKRLIAAKIVSDGEFPSWQGSLHYFDKVRKKKIPTLVFREVDSEKESEVRDYLLFKGYSILKYFNTQKENY